MLCRHREHDDRSNTMSQVKYKCVVVWRNPLVVILSFLCTRRAVYGMAPPDATVLANECHARGKVVVQYHGQKREKGGEYTTITRHVSSENHCEYFFMCGSPTLLQTPCVRRLLTADVVACVCEALVGSRANSAGTLS